MADRRGRASCGCGRWGTQPRLLLLTQLFFPICPWQQETKCSWCWPMVWQLCVHKHRKEAASSSTQLMRLGGGGYQQQPRFLLWCLSQEHHKRHLQLLERGESWWLIDWWRQDAGISWGRTLFWTGEQDVNIWSDMVRSWKTKAEVDSYNPGPRLITSTAPAAYKYTHSLKQSV